MAGLVDQQQRFRAHLLNSPVAKARPPSTKFENWMAAMHMNWYEGMSRSRQKVMKEYSEDRNRKILDTINNRPELGKQFSGFYYGPGSVDWKHAAIWAKSRGIDVETNDELMERIRKDVKVYRTYAEDIFDRATWGGKIVQFGGYAHTDMLDPVLWPAMLVGYQQAALATKFLQTVARTGLRVGAAEALMETVRQVPVYTWKQDVGADYSVKDAMLAIITTGVAAGGLGASAEAVSMGLRRLSKPFMKSTKNKFWAAWSLNTIAKELDQAHQIKRGIPAVEVAERMEKEALHQQNLPRSRYAEWDRSNIPERTTAKKMVEEPGKKPGGEPARGKMDLPDGTSKLEQIKYARQLSTTQVPLVEKQLELLKKMAAKQTGYAKQTVLKDAQNLREILEFYHGSTPAARKAMGREVPTKVRNVTHATDFTQLRDDVVDASYDDLMKSKPDTEIPTEALDIEGQPKTKKVSKVIEKEQKDFELANKLKECLL